jgi:hypothetical protein
MKKWEDRRSAGERETTKEEREKGEELQRVGSWWGKE